ncbi:BON domain-containing protein [Croceicoccus sp. F390]|uniref:BON domain-containing protein n=1 Tax=Croceicoccus esteveae TaxID=3075597 RepID=A0ABU2ZL93_9SPHN|nr:BON domain-containing protein [Croceicoccus sp. F390]MDT0576197.1 BON domain-containing protein [Croceicoccus sp. F390]
MANWNRDERYTRDNDGFAGGNRDRMNQRQQSYGSGDYDRSYDRQRGDRNDYDPTQYYDMDRYNMDRNDRQRGGYSTGSDYDRSMNQGGLRNMNRGGDDYGRTSGYSRGAGQSDYGSEDYSSFNSNDYGGRDRYPTRGRGAGYGAGGYGAAGRYSQTAGHNRYGGDDDRGFFEKAGDEISSWFDDDDHDERRRRSSHRGRGPSGYKRSDERIREDVSDYLTDDSHVDASNITVTVSNSEVTLDGTVDSRRSKRRAEDRAEDVSGVSHVQNNLRVKAVDRNDRTDNLGKMRTYDDDDATNKATTRTS